jgi:hypothetical protein
MMSRNLTRRDFLKTGLASIWGLFLAACGAEATEETIATPTSTATSTPTPTQTNTPTQTSTPTQTPIPCFTLLEPPDGATLGVTGRVAFRWSEQFGAASYTLVVCLISNLT